MADETLEIQFTAQPLDLQAAADGPPSFEMEAYRGGLLRLAMPHPVVVDTAGVELQANGHTMPILRDHHVEKPIGHGTGAVSGNSLTVSGHLSVDNDHARSVIKASKAGFPWQASIGGAVLSKRLIPRGKSVSVNGRRFSGPVFVVDKFSWRETSVTAMGADEERATTRIAAMRQGSEMKFQEWLSANGLDRDTLNDEQLEKLEATFKQSSENAQRLEDRKELEDHKQVSLADDYADQIKAAQKRAFEVSAIATRFGGRVDADKLSELHASAVDGDLTPEGFELALVREERPASRSQTLKPAYGHLNANAITAALSLYAGLEEETIAAHMKEEVGAKATEQAMNEADSLKDFNLHKLIFATLEANGCSVPAGTMVDDNVIRAALGAEPSPKDLLQASAGQMSTISLPMILSRLANKAMLSAYGDYAGVATTICSTTSTSDLKEFDRLRMTEGGMLEELGPDGEIKHSTLGEEKHTNKVSTYARMFGITEEMMINDDMGALLQIPRLIGRMSAHTLETKVIELLISLSTGATVSEFFSSADEKNFKPNFQTGTLDMDSLGVSYEQFLNQVDSDGKPIMVQPSLLLVTNKNAINAGKLYNDASYRFTNANRSEGIDNQWRGMFTPVVSPHLGSLGDTPNPDQWYLLPVPSDTSAINIAFLRGQTAPTITQSTAEFNRLGVQMRGVFRFGIAAWDRRLATKSDGSVAPAAAAARKSK